MKFILFVTVIILSYSCLDPTVGKETESKISDESIKTYEESEKTRSADFVNTKHYKGDKNIVSNEEIETVTVNTENLHKYLINLGNSIAVRIQRADGKYGHYVLKDLYKYYNALDEISTLLMYPDVSDYEEGQRLYKLLKRAGGPAHLNVTVDYNLLEKRYRWHDDHQTQDLQEVFNETRSLWENCINIAENKREMYIDKRKGRIGHDSELSDVS